MPDKKSYILGTDQEELERLKIQHDVWESETLKGWTLAEFKSGDTILDLGSGPGYCTVELAKIVGYAGKVVGVDRSESFIDHLIQQRDKKKLNISNPESLNKCIEIMSKLVK